MARKAVVDAVMARLKANWTTWPTAVLNVIGGVDQMRGDYVAVDFPVANERQISTGAPGDNIWREEGVFRILINVRRGGGVGAALAWSETLASLFRGKQFDGVQCWHVNSPPLDSESNISGYWQCVIAVGYSHDIYG